MDHLIFFDTQLFLIINHLPHTPATNALALGISGVGFAGIIWFFLTVILFIREEKKDHRFFAPVISAGIFCLIFAEKILKPLVARLRPSPEIGALIIGNGSLDYSFPSGHATIAFAMAAVLSRKEPKGKRFFYLLAVLISLSRIYVGKHYPLDVIAGAFLGWIIGLISLYATQR